MGMNPMQETYHLLKETSRFVVAKIQEGPNLADEPFYFLLNSFSVFSLGNLRTPRDLVLALDPKSAICEARGYEDYKKGLLNAFRSRSINRQPRSFILPILDDGKTINLTMSMYYSEEQNVRVFVFAELDLVAYDLNYFVKSAYQDRLTGLYNYFTLKEHLQNHERNAYLCLFDLNRFKEINDALGHEFGDLILQDIGAYLISIADSDTIFYRRSGDEFFFLLFKDEENEAIALVKKISAFLQGLSEKRFAALKDFVCDAAFGIVRYEHSGPKAVFDDHNFFDACLLSDLAMYDAKRKKRLYVLYDVKEIAALLKDGKIDAKIENFAKEAGR